MTVLKETYQHISIRTLSPAGQVEGMGRWRLLLPTPKMMAEAHTFWGRERGGGRERGRKGGRKEGSKERGNGDMPVSLQRRHMYI